MSDVKRWTMLSILSAQFQEMLQSAIIFGSSGSEAILLTNDDEVFAIGANNSSCLGTNQCQATLEPAKLESLSGKEVISLAFGSGPHVLALTRLGEVYSWGHNAFGQLGNGSTFIGTKPAVVGESLSGQKVVQIACGNHHSVAITDQGELFTWGRNSHGQLGIGSNINQEVPRRVSGHLSNRFLKSATCGQNSTLALVDGGEVFAWGFNGNGQLGVGNLCNQYSPSLVIGLHNVVISSIASGFAHSLALSDEGQLFAWGSNSCCQLCPKLSRNNYPSPVGVASSLGRIIEIAAIHPCNITVATNQLGKVYMWGQVRGQTASAPIETYFHTVDDVFACFANPPVTCRPIRFDKEHRSTILDAIRTAFDDPNTSDVQICVDGHFIHAHKALLRMRCDYFRSRFREHWKNENECSVIDVPHYSYPVYKSFLRWLYTDELHIEVNDAIELLDLANCYCENDLKKRCSEIIKQGINTGNAVLFYESAVRFGVKDLEEFCFQFCLNHMTAVTQSEAFLRVEDSIVRQFIVETSRNGAFKT